MSEEETVEIAMLNNDDLNNIFDRIKDFLRKYGKINEYKQKYDYVFKNVRGNNYIRKEIPDWIFNTYINKGEANKEFFVGIDRIKGLYRIIRDVEEEATKPMVNFIEIENKKPEKIAKEIDNFNNDIEKFYKDAEQIKNFYKYGKLKNLKTTRDEKHEAEKQAQQQQQQHEQEMKQKEEEAQQQQQQHEQEMKQKEEERKQDIAERNRIENERAANIKHKAYEEGKEEGSKHSVEEIRKILAEDRRMEAERNQTQKDYIMSKVRDGIYKLPKQKIVEIVKKDIEDKKITTDDPEKMADTIYWESVKFINKHKRTIARLSTMQGYNPTQFEQLPPTVHQAVNDYITDKWEEDIARKNRKYLLPKDLPRWERAVQQHNVNPMLGRGAWSN